MKTLTDFYRDYAEWLDSGAPNGDVFRQNSGLCSCLTRWINAKCVTEDLHGDMETQFLCAELDYTYPFNDGDHYGYAREVRTNACHLNLERIEWVREHAK